MSQEEEKGSAAGAQRIREERSKVPPEKQAGPDHAGPPCSSVQSLSRVQLFATPGTATCQASLSITNKWWATIRSL